MHGVFALFPETVLGVITAHGIDNASADPAILAGLRQEEDQVRQRLAGAHIAEDPHIAPWREASC